MSKLWKVGTVVDGGQLLTRRLEDEEPQDPDEEPLDGLVEALFEQLNDMRIRVRRSPVSR